MIGLCHLNAPYHEVGQRHLIGQHHNSPDWWLVYITWLACVTQWTCVTWLASSASLDVVSFRHMIDIIWFVCASKSHLICLYHAVGLRHMIGRRHVSCLSPPHKRHWRHSIFSFENSVFMNLLFKKVGVVTFLRLLNVFVCKQKLQRSPTFCTDDVLYYDV